MRWLALIVVVWLLRRGAAMWFARECPDCRTLWPPEYGECVQCGTRTRQVNKRPITERDARRRVSAIEFERAYQEREREREARGDPSPEDLGRLDAVRDREEIRRLEGLLDG